MSSSTSSTTSTVPSSLSRRRALQAASALGGIAALTVATGGSARAATLPGPVADPPKGDQLPLFPKSVDQPTMDFETQFAFGECGYGAGEVGELAATVWQLNQLPDGQVVTYDAYVAAFKSLGDTLSSRAADALKARRRVTARSLYLRASSYYNLALFFVLGTSDAANEVAYYQRTQACWDAYTQLADEDYQRVKIPWNGTTFPGYFVQPRQGGPKRPTVIVNNGSDAQFVDVYAFGVAAALERGYNVFVFEGPGQGSMLFERQIPFTPDWGSVVTPIVDWLVRQPKVDDRRIVLTGWSMGGDLVMRAALTEHRLAAVVADPGALDLITPFALRFPTVFGPDAQDPKDAWKGAFSTINATPPLKFLFAKRSEIYSQELLQYARSRTLFPDVQPFINAVNAFKIDPSQLAVVRSHALVLNYEADGFFGTQPQTMYAALTRAASKAYYQFTQAEGAGQHCAPMAPQRRNEVVYDWLDGVLR